MTNLVAPAPWVLIASGFHFDGGMERANAMLASYLLRTGANVHLVTHRADAQFTSDARATVHLEPPPLGSLALGELRLEWRGRRVARHLTARDFRTRVVVNGGNCEWADVNWVHYVHHAWREPLPSRTPAWFKVKQSVFARRWRAKEKAALRAARLVIANSELTRRHLIDLLNLPASRVRTIYLGAESSWAPAAESERDGARKWLQLDERPVVTFVGGLGFDDRKGFRTLWRAWTALLDTGRWDGVLLIAGAGPAASRLASEVAARGLGDRVRLLGHTNRIADVLAASDLLVSPVRYEPYGLNVQEALCRGVPALVSRQAGIAERYPSSLTGLLLDDPANETELGDALKRWRSDMPNWRNKAAAFGADLRQYGWDDMSRTIVDAAACVGSDTAGRLPALTS